MKTRLRYQSERVAGSSHKRRVMKTRLRAPAEPSPRHLPRQKPYQKHPRSLHHGICQDKNLYQKHPRSPQTRHLTNSPKNPRRAIPHEGKPVPESEEPPKAPQTSFFSKPTRAHQSLQSKWQSKHSHQTFCRAKGVQRAKKKQLLQEQRLR